jgi:branched-chain amino acid transport system substrate-binding protein
MFLVTKVVLINFNNRRKKMKHLKGFIFLLTVLLTMSWTSASQAADIVIGFTGPLSGPAAEYSQDCVTGLDMAINELNAAGGITIEGQKLLFRLEKLDDKVDPNQSMSNARQFLAHNALAIYNPVFSTQAALSKINQEECNEFILMGFTSSPKATQTGNKLLVVMNTPLTVYAQILADMAWERGWRKAAMVVTLGAYGDEWREAFKTYWKKIGGTITADKPANYYTKTDYTAPLAAAVATNPDVMLIGGPSSTTALVIEQSRNMGYKGGFLLVDQAKMDYISQMLEGTSLMENVIGLLGYSSSPALATPAFDKKYKANYRRLTTWEAVQHYDSIYYLAKAIQAANTVDDVYAIRAAFPKAFPQLSDKFSQEDYGISSAGRVYTMAGVQSIKNGKFTQPELYVWWTKTQAEFDKVKKVTKFTVPLKWFRSKMGTIE